MSPVISTTSGQRALPDTIRAAFAPVASLEEAQAYTRELATSHYENFSVVTLLLPKHLRHDFRNIYAFCRIADDLGDEVGDTALASEYLARFREQLEACYGGKAATAVFVALAGTITKHDIPIQPFLDLINAFEQDQRVNRYLSFEQLLDYCRRSADPVGRLVLYLCGYRDEERQKLSDRICTGLQLANFWQDVRRDYIDRNRIYLPADSMARFGVTEEQIAALDCDDYFRDLMKFEVQRAAACFDEGAALLPMLEPAVRRQISLFEQGGRAILRDCAAELRYAFAQAVAFQAAKRAADLQSTDERHFAEILRRQWRKGAKVSAAPIALAPADLEQSRIYCEQITRTYARNFYYGLRLLPAAKREAMYALYAWMRLVDDIADNEDGRTFVQRVDELEAWRAQTHGALSRGPLDGQPHAIWPAFCDMAARYAVPTKVFDEVIAGQQQDLSPLSFDTFDQLYEYCYRVAGVVGLASIYVWGFEGGSETEELSIQRGVAFQLTNILRDLREDAQRGRFYLPRAEVNGSMDILDLRAGKVGNQFDDSMRFQLARAEEYYQRSAPLDERISADSRPTLIAMTQIYHTLLRKIAADPARALRGRVSLSVWAKLRIGWRALRARP